MRSKKIVLVVAVLVGTVFLISGVASAASWKICQVLQAGPDQNGVYKIKLEKPNGNVKNYEVDSALDPRVQNAILAVALTALASQLDVRAYTDADTIYGMYCIQ